MYYIIAAIIIVILLFPILIHLGFRVPKNPEKDDPDRFGLEFQTVSIPTVSHKYLFAWLLPVPESTATMIIIHGWGGNAEQMLPIALPFHKAGLNVLLLDARNHGHSDKDSFSSLPRFAEDLDHAVMWLEYTNPARSQKIAFLGHSVGAGAVLLSASRRSDIDAVITVSAFAHPQWMMQRYLEQKHIPDLLIGLVVRYVEWLIGYRYEEIAPINTICDVKCPILLIHGKDDMTVPVEDALAIEKGCRRTDIDLLIVEKAGHESVNKIKAHEEKLIQFLQRSGFPI